MSDYKSKFINLLKNLFVANVSEVSVESGIGNLLHIKKSYYNEKIKDAFDNELKVLENKSDAFKNEVYEKLLNFFSQYISEQTGAIFFNNDKNSTAKYEELYTENTDVKLFWKTDGLYYVKSERIFKDTEIKTQNGAIILFTCKELQTNATNVKKELVFTYQENKDNKIILAVDYSIRASKTKVDDLAKVTKLTEEELQSAINTFKKQAEYDYFINKNVKEFLNNQLDIYLYNYIFKDIKVDSQFTTERLNQIGIIKDIAKTLINQVAIFENELVKIWEKPKLVFNTNYVITLSKIVEFGGIEALNLVLEHEDIKTQIAEWQELEFICDNFKVEDIKITKNNKKQKLLSSIEENAEESITDSQVKKLELEKQILEVLNEKYQHLPIDTKYFTSIKLKLLSYIENLDDNTNGVLIHSDNWQSLNTIKNKYKEKIDLIYIDPPFNTGSDFAYKDGFQDSTWLTLMENRLFLSRDLLSDKGSFYLHLDHHADYIADCLLNTIFQKSANSNKIIWKYATSGKYDKYFAKNYDTIFRYQKNYDKYIFNQRKVFDFVDYAQKVKNKSKIIEDNNEIYYLYNNEKRTFNKQMAEVWIDIDKIKRDGKETVGFNTQKPEALLERVIKASSNSDSTVMDYFSGSGTTIATAHKLGRKWLGVEMGGHFYSVIIPRMKKVLNYDKAGISKNYPNYTGGGIYKYYSLEQYEDVLAKIALDSGLVSKERYENKLYIWDINYSNTVKIDEKSKVVDLDLSDLYPDKEIDIFETISNSMGEPIKRITPEYMELQNGETYKKTPKTEDEKLKIIRALKPTIYWK